jgi:hypothetical protein
MITYKPQHSLRNSYKSEKVRSTEYGGWVIVGFGPSQKSAAMRGRCDRVHRHGAGSNCFSIAKCSILCVSIVATCSTDSTGSTPVHSTCLILTGNDYLDMTKFWELFLSFLVYTGKDMEYIS